MLDRTEVSNHTHEVRAGIAFVSCTMAAAAEPQPVPDIPIPFFCLAGEIMNRCGITEARECSAQARGRRQRPACKDRGRARALCDTGSKCPDGPQAPASAGQHR